MARKILVGLGALSLMTTSVAAQAVAPVAATQPVAEANELGGDNGGLIALLAVLGALAVAAFTLIDDEPVSA